MTAYDILRRLVDREISDCILPGLFRMSETVHLKQTGEFLGIMPVIEIEVMEQSSDQKRVGIRTHVPTFIQQIGYRGDVQAVGEDIDPAVGTVFLHLLDFRMVQIGL